MVMAGVVLVDERRADKPSDLFSPDAPIRIKGADDPTTRYVGRGGLKLEAALTEFSLDVRGLRRLHRGLHRLFAATWRQERVRRGRRS